MPDHKLFIFDVDGTLIRSYMEYPNPREEYERIEILPKRNAVIAKLAEQGASFAIATNQGGVAMGYQQPWEVYRKLAHVLEPLPELTPVSVHIAMHHPHAKIPKWKGGGHYRKPGPAMLEDAMAVHELFYDRERVIFVGDEQTDEEAAKNAGIDYDDAEHFFHHAVRLHT